MVKYSESPLSQLPYLELFQSGGRASQGFFWGGQSRDIFRGGPVKKNHPVSDVTLFEQLNDLQATLYGEYRRIMEEEGEAKDDEKEEVEQASK